jgi:hypothetical protein
MDLPDWFAVRGNAEKFAAITRSESGRPWGSKVGTAQDFPESLHWISCVDRSDPRFVIGSRFGN